MYHAERWAPRGRVATAPDNIKAKRSECGAFFFDLRTRSHRLQLWRPVGASQADPKIQIFIQFFIQISGGRAYKFYLPLARSTPFRPAVSSEELLLRSCSRVPCITSTGHDTGIFVTGILNAYILRHPGSSLPRQLGATTSFHSLHH